MLQVLATKSCLCTFRLSQERELSTKSEMSQSPPPKEKKSKKRKNGEGQKDANDEINDDEKVAKKKKVSGMVAL